MQDSQKRQQILELLAQVDRRLRRNEALALLARSLWFVVGVLVLLKLTGGWDAPSARGAVLVVSLLGALGYVLWHYAKGRSLARAAAVTDRRAELADTLTSALFFLDLDERTDWMELQIARSAEVAGQLSPPELTPTVFPRPLFYASGTGAMLLMLFLWNPSWLQKLEEVDFLAAARQEQAEDIEEQLDQAEALPPEEEKLEELSEALERLRRQDVELTEGLRELSEAQEALAAASRMDLEQLQMDLEALGTELEATTALSDLSDALKSQDAEEAAALLRELAERLTDAQTSEELQALLDALQNANVQNQDLQEMLENLENAAGDLTAQDLAQMAEALQDMAEQMENLGQQMAARQDRESMGEEAQELQAAMSQQSSESGQTAQQQQPSGQAMQSQTGMMSSQMQMAQMQGDPSNAVPVDAGPAGDTTGPGGGGDDQVLGEATTLDVQLEMEVLQTEEKEEPVPEEIFERLSREEKSTLNYEAVRKRRSYAEESVLGRDSIPWQYRSLVKRYFLSLHKRPESNESHDRDRERD